MKRFRVLMFLALAAIIPPSVALSRDSSFEHHRRTSQARDPSWSFKSGVYSSYLKNAREQPLVVPSLSTAYRLTVVPANRRPVVVRVELRSNGARLHATLLDGVGGYGATGIERTLDREINVAEYSELLERFAQVEKEPIQLDRAGFDGTTWLIERGSRDYRVVERWSPVDGAALDLGLYLLALTGWNLGDISKW